MCKSTTYNELWSDDPIHDGTEERCDDSNTDEDYCCYELLKRHEGGQRNNKKTKSKDVSKKYPSGHIIQVKWENFIMQMHTIFTINRKLN